MKPEKAHHCLVRLSTIDDAARIHTDSGLELTGGPTVTGWRGDWWRAEDLLLAAVETSLLSSFREQARSERLPIGAFRCTGEAVFHEGKDAPLGRLVLRIELETAPEDLLRAEAALWRAKEACVVARALTVPLELQVTTVQSGARVETPR
jgi:hypothetical protein